MVLMLMAILLAAQDDEAAGAVAACEAVFLKTKDTSPRVEAIGSMSQTQHEKVIVKLTLYAADPDKAVKAAALQGLASCQSGTSDIKRLASKAIVNALGAGANLKDVDFKVAALAALGTLQEENAILTIKTLLDDKDQRVASAAVNACVAMRAKPLIEPLMQQHRECEKAMKANSNGPAIRGKRPTSARKDPNAPQDPEEAKAERGAMMVTLIPPALQTLTGQTFANGDEMEKWWAKNRIVFTISK